MENELIQIFTARITQANRSELVVILYEVVLSDIHHAVRVHRDGDLETFDKDLKHAEKFMNELISTLDFNITLSLELMQLYLYVNKRIIQAMIQRKTEPLESARKVMDNLKIGFEGVAKEDNSEALMKNTQQLYAGLTYGKGVLNETYIDPNQQSRGFKA